MNEKERELRIKLLRETLSSRSLNQSGKPACYGCSHPFNTHKPTSKGLLICSMPGCDCHDYMMPRVPDQVELACDEMFAKLRRFQVDRTDHSLHALAKSVKAIENLFFEPYLLHNGKALQVCNRRLTWVGPENSTNCCSKAFPRDEPVFYTNELRRRHDQRG